MEYNTSREKLILPEYGRNIQEMVRHAMTIEDRDERTRCAATIVKTMLTLFPRLREDDNYKQKVWDHIAMMADYKLDVDSPYPLPQQQILPQIPPQRMRSLPQRMPWMQSRRRLPKKAP